MNIKIAKAQEKLVFENIVKNTKDIVEAEWVLLWLFHDRKNMPTSPALSPLSAFYVKRMLRKHYETI